MVNEEIKKEIRSRLEAAFPHRLQGVLLYGSQARNEARDESDLDLMVLLEEPVRLGRDLDTIVEALYPLQLQIDAPIHATPVSAEVFRTGAWSLHRNVQREGVAL